ncbi:hypothetical protein HXX24_04765 [Acholeplasma laidlawii]|uniref:DUF2357 domain-containing protein n=1 Tax=Acholeplasma laidlawii TaxID=2148 RepID=A0A553IH91_ACHLA|nr:hypothetical protein [Acholeplasma laidlawii]NWH11198.1 hypothetical protein [Acholeplasma laidlawii]NWH13391.1 hypothetical protein [Acholeplasma laidlawii]NWH14060.1 hypothetical protein [Acholeplasma laidlawii]TRX99567.1 hypothetical protein FNV44_00570 [Acholeplasma laidlawii]
MKNSYDLDLFYTMLISRLDELEEDTDFPVYFYQGLYDGVNKLKQVETTETKKFDDHWIFAIESYYPYVDKILRNYKSALRVEEEVVIVEKAKKTTSRTVRHLAANTHLLKLPDKDQPTTEVMPKKLLVEFSEDEFGIYENRFVATLIQRLVDFVSRRMRILEEDVNTKKIKELNNTIELSIDNSKYEINIDLREVQTIDQGKIEEDNQKLLARAQELHKKLANALNTEFMKTMRNYRKVKAPIMKTQIILKNTNYRNCYLLWKYLDQYNSLGFELIRDVKQKRFNETYRKHLSQNALFAFSTMMFHDVVREKDQKLLTKSFKVKKAEEIKLTADELKIDPESYKIEDTLMNEFYLNKTKQMFKKTIDQYMQTEPKYEVALRKALKDTIEITNSLYASYFEINQDDDVFDRLVQETNPKDDLDSADEKFKIASIVRQLKEADYKKAIALEKKWYQTTLRYQKRFFKSVKLDSDEKLKKEAKRVSELNEEYIKLQRVEMLDEQKVQVAKDNEMLLELKTQYRERYKKEAKRIADIQKRKAERELERLRKRKEKAQEKLRISKEKQKLKQKQYIDKQKEKIKASHDKAMAALKKGK